MLLIKNTLIFTLCTPPMSFSKKELTFYDVSKGTIDFPLGQPLPVRLIGTIVKFRVEQN
jgi:uncharacterized protein YdhG (YjbR/CyaY superfamily)